MDDWGGMRAEQRGVAEETSLGFVENSACTTGPFAMTGGPWYFGLGKIVFSRQFRDSVTGQMCGRLLVQ